jgi:hypothetical protein
MTARQTRLGFVLCGLFALALRIALELPSSSLRGSTWAVVIATVPSVALAIILWARQPDSPATFNADPRRSRFVVPADPAKYFAIVLGCFFFGQMIPQIDSVPLAGWVLLALGFSAALTLPAFAGYTSVSLSQHGVTVRQLFGRRTIRWYDFASQGVSVNTANDATYLLPCGSSPRT